MSPRWKWPQRPHVYAFLGRVRNGLERGILPRTGSWPIEVADNVCHTGLVAHKGGQVHWFFGVILNIRISDSSIIRCEAEVRTFGKDLTFPLWRAARFLGRKPKDPWRGASYYRSQPPSTVCSLFLRQIRPTNLTMTVGCVSKCSSTTVRSTHLILKVLRPFVDD